MATAARSGHGCKIGKTGGTAVAEVLSIGGPSQSRDMLDATSMDSEDQFKEFIGGLVDAGEVTLEMNFLLANTEHKALMTDIYAAALTSWTLSWATVFGNAPKIVFDGWVSGVEATTPHDGKLTLSATIKITGKPVPTWS